MSEVIPEDEDRGGDGAMKDAIGGPGASDDAEDVGGVGGAPGATTEEESGLDPDDGGPGSQNM